MSNDISTEVQYIYTIGGKNVNKQLPGYNLYTICNKMSNDFSTDVQYIYNIGGKKCQMILVQMYNIFTLLNFFLFFKIRVYKRNNEQLIDASLFLIFEDPLLD